MFENVPGIALQLAIGAVGAALAYWIGAPMPFLLGSLGITATLAMSRVRALPASRKFPEPLRRSFVAIVGVMIGQSFTPELTGLLGTLWLSLAAVAVYVVIAHFAGFLVYSKLGGYDRPTAIFASVPGGLVEAIAFGEQAGGNTAIVTMQHFVRVVLVIVIVPVLFQFWTGESVGSATGEAMSQGEHALSDTVFTVVIALVGMVLGRRLRIPAPMLIGPLLLSAGFQITGVLPLQAPGWLLNLSQLVIGVGLGAAFYDISRKQLVRSLGLGVVAMVIYLALGLGMAVLVANVTPIARDALFISFAPGGVTEMSLIALSLGIGPVIVAAHHVFRISITVVFMTILSKHVQKADDEAAG